MYRLDDTIAAIASPLAPAARGIVRVSGPQAIGIVAGFFIPGAGAAIETPPTPHVATGALALEGFHSRLPCDLFVWPTSRSYTRQPLIEIHTFGSPPLLTAVLSNLVRRGARLAQPGEFTLRAFLSGRIDLTQAEAVLGVIDAESQDELHTALAQLAGGLSRPMQRLRDELLDLLAEVEAALDFAEEDIVFIDAAEAQRRLEAAVQQIEQLLTQVQRRGHARPEARVVLVGWPNVGKSSLFNCLAQRAEALVSDAPGTTRDYLIGDFDADGLVCQLIDTAGVAEQGGLTRVESAAQAMMREQRKAADVEIFCIDATRPLNDWEQAQLSQPNDRRIIALTKIDRLGVTLPHSHAESCFENLWSEAVLTSSVTATGMTELRQAVGRTVAASSLRSGDVIAATANRCQESLEQARHSLLRARTLVESRLGEELLAAELRTALAELGKVVGAVYTDDLLDRIFGRFCIGK